MPLPKKRTQELVSAPAPLAIKGPDGTDRTFLVVPPSKKDSLTTYRWAVQHLKEAKPAGLSSEELKGLCPEDRAVLLKEYARAAKGKRAVTEQDIQDAMLTPEGLAFMVWVAAKKQDPALKLQDVQALVTEGNCDQVFADFADATGIDEEGEVDPKAPGSDSSSPT